MIDFLETKEGIIGGTEKQLLETVKRLDKEKFEVTIVALQKWGRNAEWDKIENNKKILHVYSLHSIKTFFSFLGFVRYLKRESHDIIFTYFFDSTLFGVLAAKVAGVKTIISCRRDMGFWKNRNLHRWLSFTNRLADRWLVNCHAIKDELARNENVPPNLIDVIYNGVDIKLINNSQQEKIHDEYTQIKQNDSIVGIVSNFNRQIKRLDIFIEAAAEISKIRRNVKFIIIGGGIKYEKDLRELAKERGISDLVIFGGFKEDPVPYMKNFDIGVLTSDSEGLSNTILEYMAVGIPCVVTETGGNRELIKDGVSGSLVPPGNPLAVAKSVCSLLQDSDKAKRMAMEAKRTVEEKFFWDIIIKKIEDYYFSFKW
jgi:glycosyltransferase involved in cell wall biosynthesis